MYSCHGIRNCALSQLSIDNLLVASVVAGIPSTLVDVLASPSVALEARQTPAEVGADNVAASGVARAR